MKGRRTSPRTPTKSELSAKDEFDGWLRGQMPTVHVTWEVPDHDPPDFYLSFDGEKYAVEVTDMMTNRTHVESYAKFIEGVQREARTRGILSGSHLVSFDYTIADWRKTKREVRTRLLEYVESAGTLPVSTASHVIKVNGRSVARVVSAAGSPRLVYLRCTVFGYKDHPDVASPIEKIVATKAEKLNRSGVALPTILLVRDRHDARPRPEDYPTHISGQEQFHTIFIANVNRQWSSFVLCSKDESWASMRKEVAEAD